MAFSNLASSYTGGNRWDIAPVTEKDYVYSDIPINLDLSPMTGDIVKRTDTDAIKNSILQIISTKPGERFFNTNYGSKINNYLFDIIDESTAENIRSEIENALKNFNKRINVENINVVPDYENETYQVFILFNIINITDQTTIYFTLNRVK